MEMPQPGDTVWLLIRGKYLCQKWNCLGLMDRLLDGIQTRIEQAKASQKVRDHLDLAAAKAIYHSMILPSFIYSGILQLILSDTQLKWLTSFHNRSLRIIQGNSGTGEDTKSVINANKICACKLVPKCIDKDICNVFQGYLKSKTAQCEQGIINA